MVRTAAVIFLFLAVPALAQTPSQPTPKTDSGVLTPAGAIQAADVRLMLEAVAQCQINKGKPLKDGWLDRSESERRVYQMVCIAYTMGRSDEKRETKP